jgi:hypothetical protein
LEFFYEGSNGMLDGGVEALGGEEGVATGRWGGLEGFYGALAGGSVLGVPACHDFIRGDQSF